MARKRKSDHTTEVIIDAHYIATMGEAAKLHNPVARLSDRLKDTLGAIAALDIRRPNDWCFEYTGGITLRWYDGDGDHFASSSKHVSINVWDNDCHIRGRLKKSYSGDAGITIEGMKIEESLAVLKILVGMVDNGTQT